MLEHRQSTYLDCASLYRSHWKSLIHIVSSAMSANYFLEVLNEKYQKPHFLRELRSKHLTSEGPIRCLGVRLTHWSMHFCFSEYENNSLFCESVKIWSQKLKAVSQLNLDLALSL